MKKLLVISHDATLTGAPILLLNLLKILKEENKFEIKIVIKNGIGNLITDFENVAPTSIWRRKLEPSFLMKIFYKFFNPWHTSDKKIQAWITESDVVLSNTITNGNFLNAFSFSPKTKVISYIHELEIASTYYSNTTDFSVLVEKTHVFAVPSKAVGQHLNENLLVKAEHIKALNYYIPFNTISGNESGKLNTDFIVGIVGTLDWRKGADIISVILATFYNKYSETKVIFKWQGADMDSIEYKRIAYELKKLGLQDQITFLPATKNVATFYNSIDVLLLTSKEDPYPLVVLEAASFSKPCICFENSGGAPEFVETNAGGVIPYLDIVCLADTIYTYYSNIELTKKKGEQAFIKYQQLHLNKAKIIQQFSDLLQ